MGGDADSTGGIVGAIMGALHGTNWIPKRWFDNFENEKRGGDSMGGKDRIIYLGRKLANINLTSRRN